MSLSIYLSGAASFLAGFIDSIVGGGGLIQLPALLILHPTLPYAEISSINKTASFAGTLVALIRYSRTLPFDRKRIVPGTLFAFLFAIFGAYTATLVSTAFMKPLALFILAFVALYTFAKKDLGSAVGHPSLPSLSGIVKISLIGATIGFYDGIFGPGTGSFFVFLIVIFFGLDFLKATVEAKALNLATNIAAILTFAASGYFRPDIFLPLAVCNVAGSFCGTWVALRYGSKLVRKLFLCVVVAILIKLGFDSF